MRMIINGNFVDSVKNETYPVYNPYNGEVIDSVPKAKIEDIKLAIDAANRSKNEIKNLELEKRLEILLEASDIIKKSKDEFVDLLVEDAGHPIKHATWEVEKAHNTLKNSLLHVKEFYGEQIPSNFPDKFSFILREPAGLVSAILPLNAPLALPSILLTHSLIAGNTIVLKAASETPLSALKFGEILLDAGLPKGTFNVVTGSGRELGGEMINNPKVDMIAAFTGVDAAKAIASQSAGILKKFFLELPGKNPFIVLDKCDIEKAVDACVYGSYVNSGQICMAVETIMVHENIIEEFTGLLVKKTEKLRLGDPKDFSTDIGPLPSEKHLDAVDKQVKDAVKNGANTLIGGNYEDLIYEPTILSSVTPDMKIVTDRTSGPIAPLIKIKDLNDAIEIANNLKLRLRASVFTNDLEEALISTKQLKFGGVMVNGTTFYTEHHFPWGGLGDSGLDGADYLISKLTTKKLVTFHS